MKAFVVEKYGKTGLRAAKVPDPTIGPRDVLVRVSAASINPLDKMDQRQFVARSTSAVRAPDTMSRASTRVGATCGTTKAGDLYTPARPAYRTQSVAIDHADIASSRTFTMEESAAVPLAALAAWRRWPASQ